MIPKIIHYCWFGGNPLPELAKKCISSWKKFLPDYEIKEWNESNYDVRKIPYIAQAYDAKKYAFVSDYARFVILYQYGGIYFDTDVEVIKPLDSILENGAFCGVECDGALNAGLGIASPEKLPILQEILESYKKSSFIKENGDYDFTTVVERVSKIFSKYGFTNENKIQNIAGFTVYPSEYFNPIDYYTHRLNITPNTYTIHHGAASWVDDFEKKYAKVKVNLRRIFGVKLGGFFALVWYSFANMKNVGIRNGMNDIFAYFQKRKK